MNLRQFIILSLLLFALPACKPSGRPDDLPRLYPCTITLKQEGAPLADAMIYLHSTNPAFSWTVGGRTDPAGNVSLMTHAKFPGVPTGDYKIVVSKTERYQEKPPEIPPGGDESMRTAGSPVILYSLVEKEYTNQETTPLTITIDKGKNQAEFELGKAVRIELETVVF